MGRIKELAEEIAELKHYGEVLISISGTLTDLFSSSEKEQKEQVSEENKPTVSLEEVRKVLAEKSRAGFTAEVKEIIRKHGAEKLSDINSEDFESVLAEAEVLNNA